jgi:hypothetical protein
VARVLEPVHLYTACGSFTAANSSVNIFEVTASTYSAHDDTEAQAALLGNVRADHPPKRSSNNRGISSNMRMCQWRRRRDSAQLLLVYPPPK